MNLLTSQIQRVLLPDRGLLHNVILSSSTVNNDMDESQNNT